MFEGIFQPMHLIIILAIALIIFGPGKLPELGKGLGKSIREFKKAMSGEEQDTVKGVQKEIAAQDSIAINKDAASQNAAEEKKEHTSQDTSAKQT